MKKTIFLLSALSTLMLVSCSSNPATQTDIIEYATASDIQEQALALNSVKNSNSTFSYSKTYVQAGEINGTKVLRFATAVKGDFDELSYIRSMEGKNDNEETITTLYYGIEAEGKTYYYNGTALSEDSTYRGNYYWACYTIKFESETYLATDIATKLSYKIGEAQYSTSFYSSSLNALLNKTKLVDTVILTGPNSDVTSGSNVSSFTTDLETNTLSSSSRNSSGGALRTFGALQYGDEALRGYSAAIWGRTNLKDAPTSGGSAGKVEFQICINFNNYVKFYVYRFPTNNSLYIEAANQVADKVSISKITGYDNTLNSATDYTFDYVVILNEGHAYFYFREAVESTLGAYALAYDYTCNWTSDSTVAQYGSPIFFIDNVQYLTATFSNITMTKNAARVQEICDTLNSTGYLPE